MTGSELPLALTIAAYAAAINLAGFLAFAWDKRCARRGSWRVPERTLLTLAAAGGTFGALAGQKVLRHKTRKEPFRTRLLVIVALQVAILGALCVPQLRVTIWASAEQSVARMERTAIRDWSPWSRL